MGASTPDRQHMTVARGVAKPRIAHRRTFHREQRILQAEQLHIRFCFSEAATADAFRGLEIHRVSVDAAAHHVGSDWSLTLLRRLNDDQPRAATMSLSGSLG